MTIQRVNIEKIIHENLPEEVELLSKEIFVIQENLNRLQARRNLLLNIAEVAGVKLERYLRDGEAGRDRDESNSTRLFNPAHDSTPLLKKMDTSPTTIRGSTNSIISAGEEFLSGVGAV